jgi:hypothetical protein
VGRNGESEDARGLQADGRALVAPAVAVIMLKQIALSPDSLDKTIEGVGVTSLIQLADLLHMEAAQLLQGQNVAITLPTYIKIGEDDGTHLIIYERDGVIKLYCFRLSETINLQNGKYEILKGEEIVTKMEEAFCHVSSFGDKDVKIILPRFPLFTKVSRQGSLRITVMNGKVILTNISSYTYEKMPQRAYPINFADMKEKISVVQFLQRVTGQWFENDSEKQRTVIGENVAQNDSVNPITYKNPLIIKKNGVDMMVFKIDGKYYLAYLSRSGANIHKFWELEEGLNTFGRDSNQNTICSGSSMALQQISRQHLSIGIQGDQIILGNCSAKPMSVYEFSLKE